jgi:hypothetical protein
MNTLLPPPPPIPTPAPVSAAPPAPGIPVPVWFVWACPCCQATLRTLTSATRGACPACGSLIEAPSPPAPTPASTSTAPGASPARRVLAWLRRHGLRVAVLGAVVAGVGLLARTLPWPRVFLGPATSATTAPPSVEDLQKKLAQFLKAPDWAAKRGHVLDAERLDRTGSAYYQGRDADEVHAGDFHPYSLPSLARTSGVAVLRAERPGRRPVLAVFRRSGNAWHLDWELFTQTYDEALPAFISAPAFPIRTFRTRLSRVFPASPENPVYAIEVSDILDPGQRITIQLPFGTPIMQSVASGLSGSAPQDATVEVCWARSTPDGAWEPMLQRLVCWGWHGLNGLPETAAPAPPAARGFITPAAAPLDSPPPPAENTAPATSSVASK